jgi:cytochrome c oxidase cbb3-type subunit III
MRIEMSKRIAVVGAAAGLSALAAVFGWMREPRHYRASPPLLAALDKVRLMPNGISGAPPEVYFALGKPYETTAFDLSQGKRLYSWFGCSGCHGEGTGGKGPSFIDGWWLYGPSMVSIVASIRDGRPHGMPAFRNRMTSDEIWQLAGYIKSLGAYKASVNAPSRNDAKINRPAENRAPASALFNQGPEPLHRDQGPRP